MEDPVHDIIPLIHTLVKGSPSQQHQTLTSTFTPTASFTHPFCRTGSYASSRTAILYIYQWYKILSPRIEIVIDSVAFDERNLLLYVGMRQNFRLWVAPWHVADVGLTTVLKLTEDSQGRNPGETVWEKGNVEDIRVKGEEQARGFGRGESRRRRDSSSSSSGNEGSGKVQDTVSSRGDEDTRQGGRRKKYYIQSQNDLYQTTEWIKFVSVFGVATILLLVVQFFNTGLCVLGAVVLSPITALYERVLGGNVERVKTGEVFGED